MTIRTIDQLLGSPNPLLDKVFTALQKDGIGVATYELDHICYRVAEMDRYVELKEQIAGLGQLLGENTIGGRPIASFRLNEPIRYREREIYVLELPAPKVGSDYPEGFEHVEFVIDRDLEAFVAQYPALAFKTKGIHKGVNADVQLVYPGFGVKFHRQSLEDVIRSEK